jgi:hypothetical protein
MEIRRKAPARALNGRRNNSMLGYIFKRVLYMIPTLFGMSLISFLIIQLPPGDYLTSMIATMSDSGQAVDPAQIERLKEIYGFDDPFYIQYLKWIWGIVSRGDFGYSFEWNQPVSGLIWARMGSTLVISLLEPALRLDRRPADRHLFGRSPPLRRRPRLHLLRLHRPRGAELHPCADADVYRL